MIDRDWMDAKETEENSYRYSISANPEVCMYFPHVLEIGEHSGYTEFFMDAPLCIGYFMGISLEGEGFLYYEGEQYFIPPGSVFWVDCMKAPHFHINHVSGQWRFRWVRFDGPICVDYYQSYLCENRFSPVVALDPSEHLSDAHRELNRLYAGSDHTKLVDICASGVLTQMMIGLIKCAAHKSTGAQIPKYIGLIQSYIDENCFENITLASLAKKFSINKYYLQKVFKRFVGQSPNDYLTSVRIRHAKSLLRSTDDSMIQIAQAVGYTATYFDNVFKRYVGVPPRIYRRDWLKIESIAENTEIQTLEAKHEQ